MKKEKSRLEKVKYYLGLFVLFATVVALACIDAWFGKDFFLKALISAVSIIALVAIGVIFFKHGWDVFGKIAVLTVFRWLKNKSGSDLAMDTPDELSSLLDSSDP